MRLSWRMSQAIVQKMVRAQLEEPYRYDARLDKRVSKLIGLQKSWQEKKELELKRKIQHSWKPFEINFDGFKSNLVPTPVVLNLFVLEAHKRIKNSSAAHFHMTIFKTQTNLFNGTANYIVVLTSSFLRCQAHKARYRCGRSVVRTPGRSHQRSVANGSPPLRRFFRAV